MENYRSRAERSIGQGTTTNSKHWDSHVRGVYPTHIKSSNGPYIIDVNDKRYLDFICGLGTNLFGYGFPLVEKEVEKYRHEGKSPSLPHIIEVEVAEQLKQVFPWVQKWKFLKTGSEACSAAVRMARAHTGNSYVVSEGYHGWHDLFTSLTPPANGVSDDHSIVTRADVENMHEVACILPVACMITEPVQTKIDSARRAEILTVREFCSASNSVLIHDEVITGFRYKNHSVSKHHDVIPDLIVIGKAMANGYPLAAVGGPSDILDNDYFVSSTYAGEVTAMAACKAVLSTIRTKPEFFIDRLWESGEKFLKGFNEAAKPLGFEIEGYATRGVFKGDELNIALFMQEACLAGLLFGKSWFISFAHISVLDIALESCKDILGKMERRRPVLLGHLPKSPFSMRSRQ